MGDLAENGCGDFYRSDDLACRNSGRFRSTQTEADRFWSKVRFEPGEGCWIWTGGLTADGYGRFMRTPAAGVPGEVRAHRYAWELLVGPIPEGLTLDHTDICLRPACVRPSHLEPVTNSENVRRRHARRRAQNGANR